MFKQNQSNRNCDWLAGLHTARDKMLQFIEDLGPIKQTQLREDVMTHCQNNAKNQKNFSLYISSDIIAKIVNIRIQKMIKNKRIKKNWSEEDVNILIWLISKYADINHYQDIGRDLCNQDWEFLSTLIPGVTPESCMFKWLSLKKVNLASNNWSQQESILLGNVVRQHVKQSKKSVQIKDWKTISQKLYKLKTCQDKIFRNAKQCRQHWNCYLNPNLRKGPWRAEEDIKLLKRIQQNKGSKKWSQIVRDFDGRTQNALKNRYTLIIDKQGKYCKGRSQLQLIQDYLQNCQAQQFSSVIKTGPSQPMQGRSAYPFDDMSLGKMDQEYKLHQPHIQRQKTPYKQSVKKQKYDQIAEDSGLRAPVKIEKFKFQNFSSLSKTWCDKCGWFFQQNKRKTTPKKSLVLELKQAQQQTGEADALSDSFVLLEFQYILIQTILISPQIHLVGHFQQFYDLYLIYFVQVVLILIKNDRVSAVNEKSQSIISEFNKKDKEINVDRSIQEWLSQAKQ